jgi:hypothetical protein
MNNGGVKLNTVAAPVSTNRKFPTGTVMSILVVVCIIGLISWFMLIHPILALKDEDKKNNGLAIFKLSILTLVLISLGIVVAGNYERPVKFSNTRV